MNLVLFAHQFRALVRPRRLVGLMLLGAVPGLILLILGLADEVEGVPELVAEAGATTFSIAALILAAATLRHERDGGTLPYLYLKPIPRLTLASTSVIAAVAGTAIIGVVAALSIVLAGVVVGVDVSIGLATLPMYLAAAVGYSAVFVPLGYLVPRVILTGLAYVIVWEQIVARLVAGVANTSVWRFALSIYADLVGEGLADELGPVTPGTWGGLAKIGGILVVAVVVLTWALRSRDAI